MPSSAPRTPIALGMLGLVLAAVSFVASVMKTTNDGVSAGIKGVLFIVGVALLVVAPWGLAFVAAEHPWTKRTRVLWFFWLTIALPTLCVGLLVAFGSLWSLLER